MAHAACTLLVLTVAALPAQATSWRWLATEHIGTLLPKAALAEVGLAGTDLGVSFPCGDRLVFLFGDSWTLDRRERDHDSVAWTGLGPLAAGVPPLEWYVREGGRFMTLAPPEFVPGGMDVPVEGFTVGDRSYVFFSSGWSRRTKRHSHSLLTHANGHDFGRLELDHRVATDKFVNLSLVADGDQVWIFGSGAYRKSSLFLARVAPDELADRSAWRYWPEFGADESTARPIVRVIRAIRRCSRISRSASSARYRK